jgi:hypothetical protein
MIVFYLGPDSLLPLGSLLAAVAGFVLLFWNRITGVFRKGRRSEADPAEDAPRERADPQDSPDKPGI